MIIRDKQDLRKCVKQCVRRVGICETAAKAGILSGGYGIANWLGTEQREGDSLSSQFFGLDAGAPFAARPAELLAALDALNLPVHDLNKAEAIISGYDRGAYLSLVLDALRARRVMIETELDCVDSYFEPDERFAPLLVVREPLFTPGRYGVDYAQCAQQIAEAAQNTNARDIKLEVFDASALAYCLIPVCEDLQMVLHVHLTSNSDCSQWQMLKSLLIAHPQVRVLISADDALECVLIDEIAPLRQALVRIENPLHIPHALTRLGTRFVPYASHAATPEELLGRWIRIKETIWQALCDAYLPLARTGYELTRDQIEADAELLLGGNLMKLYE